MAKYIIPSSLSRSLYSPLSLALTLSVQLFPLSFFNSHSLSLRLGDTNSQGLIRLRVWRRQCYHYQPIQPAVKWWNQETFAPLHYRCDIITERFNSGSARSTGGQGDNTATQAQASPQGITREGVLGGGAEGLIQYRSTWENKLHQPETPHEPTGSGGRERERENDGEGKRERNKEMGGVLHTMDKWQLNAS